MQTAYLWTGQVYWPASAASSQCWPEGAGGAVRRSTQITHMWPFPPGVSSDLGLSLGQ